MYRLDGKSLMHQLIQDLSVNICVSAVKVPLDAYMMDFVFSEKEDGGIFDNKNGMDYHIPVFGGVAKEPPMQIVHIAVEMAPIAKVSLDVVQALCIYKRGLRVFLFHHDIQLCGSEDGILLFL